MNDMTRPALPSPAMVRDRVTKLTPQFARALPPGLSADRFARVVLTAIQQNADLLLCTEDSLWGACMKAAQDGLLPDGREGAIVPRYNKDLRAKEAHWMPMVAGLIAKAKRKGSVASLVAHVVYQGEEFEVLLGDEERIVHRRDMNLVKRGKEVGVYAIATMKDGTKEREPMTWEQVEQVRGASQGGGTSGPWKTWPEEMARKSCIRRLSKRLPGLDDGDDELRRAVERVDELYDFGKPPAPALPSPGGTSGAPAISHEATIEWDMNEGAVESSLAARESVMPTLDLPAERDSVPAASDTLRAVAERVRPQSPQMPDPGDEDDATAADKDAEQARGFVAQMRKCGTDTEFLRFTGSKNAKTFRAWMEENRPDLDAEIAAAQGEMYAKLIAPPIPDAPAAPESETAEVV